MSKSYYVYVDNISVLCLSEIDVSGTLSVLHSVFEEQGLSLHSGEIHPGSVRSLGVSVDGHAKETRVELDRLWKIRQSIRRILAVGSTYGRILEVVIGHCTFAGLVRRLVLCIFFSTYRFIESSYDVRSPLWDSVREELEAFMGALFLLRQRWDQQWNRLVTSSDASMTGYGVCHAWWRKERGMEPLKT